MKKFLSSIVLSILLLNSITAYATGIPKTKLYSVRLLSVKIPKEIQDKAKKDTITEIADTYLYAAVFVDGNLIDYYSKIPVKDNQILFNWADGLGSIVACPWSKQQTITIKFIFSDSDIPLSGRNVAVGAVGGAASGALIGGVLAGVFTGGLGAPAGAGIGALIGGVIGGGAGVGVSAVLPEKDSEVFSMEFSGEESFPLNGEKRYVSPKMSGDSYTATAKFKVEEI